MKILVACHEGNNRSVTIASFLKYWSHDILTCGVATNTKDTLDMLSAWADRVIVVEESLSSSFPDAKVQLWDIGPDKYPRPHNPDLLRKVKFMMEEHRVEYKSGS